MGDCSIHVAADGEIVDAVRRFLGLNPATAAGLTAEFERVVGMIRRFPEQYPLYDDSHRFAPLRKYPYSIVYRTDGTNVRVIAVPHDKQRPGYWAGRR